MHPITKLVSLLFFGASLILAGCEDVDVDTSGGQIPPAGVIRGTVNYVGPPPCSQNGHIVGNAVILVFSATNPPPPSGLANTAVNFGVVAGDVLFANWPATQGTAKVCPDSSAPSQIVSAPYVIAPVAAGQYQAQAFFDYTGDFFATFKFRNLPEATDVGGGYINVNDATKLVPNLNASPNTQPDGGTAYPTEENQSDPNYLPIFEPINVGTAGPVSPISLRGVPASFTMPDTGYIADNVSVTIGQTLPYSRPYFYPKGVNSTALDGGTASAPISNIQYFGSSATRVSPAPTAPTPQNPKNDPDFVPVVSFPQDIQIYAQPTLDGILANLLNAPTIFSQYQAALPSIVLQAGVYAPEQNVAADIANASDPFHMQLGLPGAAPSPYVYAPGGNGGIYVWWNAESANSCTGLANCDTIHQDFIPEQPGLVFRMWPLIVLAKLVDLPSGAIQPNPNDPEAVTAQGTDLTKPIVIIQGITLNQDKFIDTVNNSGLNPVLANSASGFLPTGPDFTGNSNRYDHVTALIRPSTLCMDPRAPDHGGILVTTGQIQSDGTVHGAYAPADQAGETQAGATTGIVIDSAKLTNPQLAQLVNRQAAGSTNGLVGGCLPLGRYEVNLVYPTGQAWTTPNETGSCATAEGTTSFTSGGSFIDPGTCSLVSPRPVLYSQGTRAVVEITPATDPKNCAAFSATGLPVGPDGKTPTADGSPFACSGLCPDPSEDPTATATNPPCSLCLDPAYSVTGGSAPCTVPISGSSATASHPVKH